MTAIRSNGKQTLRGDARQVQVVWRRVLGGGIAGGLVISAVWLLAAAVFAADFVDLAARLGLVIRPIRMLAGALLSMPVLGGLMVWLYAVTADRDGESARTAATAGLAVFLITFVVDGAWAALGAVSLRVFAIIKLVDLTALVLGAIVGAEYYRRRPSISDGQ